MATKSRAKTEKVTVDAAKMAANGRETFDAMLKAGAEGYEKAFGAAKVGTEDVVKGYEVWLEMGRDNFAAFATASDTYARSMEVVSAEMLAYHKQNMEAGSAAVQSMVGAKTVQEAFEKQSAFAKSWLEGMVAHSTKMSELTTKAAQDAAAPIQSRINATIDKVVSAA